MGGDMRRISVLLFAAIICFAYVPDPGNAQEQPGTRCRPTGPLEVCLLELSVKGSAVYVSLTVTNKTDKPIQIGMNGNIAEITTPSGERQGSNNGYFAWTLSAKATEHLAYAWLELKQPVDSSGKFDFVLSFQEPASRFGFLNVPVTDRKPVKTPICKTGQFFKACIMETALRGPSLSVDFSLENLTGHDVQISRNGVYAVASDAKGQTARKQTGYVQQTVAARGGTAQMSETFSFQEPSEGDVADVMFNLQEPYSKFGFFNVKVR